MNTMTAAEIAAADQAQAKVRNQDRFLHNAALLFVWVFFSLGVYAMLAATGNAPAMPWSPIGQVQQQDHVPSPPSHLPSQNHIVEV